MMKLIKLFIERIQHARYAHPFLYFQAVFLGIFFAIFCISFKGGFISFVFAAIFFCIGLLFYPLQRNYRIFYLSKTSLFNSIKCIEQRNRIRIHDDECPKAVFIKEWADIVNDMKRGDIYTTGTHVKVIQILKALPEYQKEQIFVTVLPYSGPLNLWKTKGKMANAQCQKCQNKCSIYYASCDKSKKQIVTTYAVVITKLSD